MTHRPYLKDLLGKQLLFFDGATGTVLQHEGLTPGELPETWNITHPDKIVALHYNYLKAGCNILKTNTFGAYTTKFSFSDLQAVVRAAVANAKEARRLIEEEAIADDEVEIGRHLHTVPLGELPRNRPHYIALDIGPSGKLLKPMGDLDFEDAVTLFKTTIRMGLSCGVDAILIETINDCYEAKAAVLAAHEAIDEYTAKTETAGDLSSADGYERLPVFCTTVYDEHAQLLTGADPETMTAVLEGLRVDAFGMNCGMGPIQMEKIVPRLAAAASVPIIVNPNAGLPRSENGRTVYDIDALQFATVMERIVDSGASVVGGCCGTDPEYICRLVDMCRDKTVAVPTERTDTVISSYTHTVSFGAGAVPVLIGERINPTGKKRFKQALRDNDIPYVIQQGIEQEECGAVVLDVNVGLPEIDEKVVMVSVMTELQAVTTLPLQIDTSSPEVMEAALRRYNGKPLINSVNGKEEIMRAIFPLVKKYGGVVVALTLDETGIPETTEGRMKIVRKIYDRAAEYGISKKNIVIDPLAMAVSADSEAPSITLETVRAVAAAGGRTILGVSNVSFGLPKRDLVTSTFFTMALQNGLSAAIMNPHSAEMMKAYTCFCLLSNRDPQCLSYINFAQQYESSSPVSGVGVQPSVIAEPRPASEDGFVKTGTLEYSVIHGLRTEAAGCAEDLLKSVPSLEIINEHLIPALDIVGRDFETKKIYLPQLLMSAEAAKSAFAVIKKKLAISGKTGKSRGKIVIATVKGDIHDIGKNIVKVLLENYDFTVIDLGKDVPPETIVERCVQEHAPIVGLSALMTTTVPAMEATIVLLRKEAPWAKVCVGGAVMTKEYADMIGADFYGKDAMETVRYAERVMAGAKQ